MLRECASALSYSDSTQAWHALIRGRNCQPLVDAMRQSLRASGEVATLAPAYRRHRDELDQMEQSLDYIDLALRNSRVFARRLTSAINHAALSDEATENIAEVLQETAAAVDELSLGLAEVHDGARRAHLRTARPELRRDRRPAASADAGRPAAGGRNGGHAVPPAHGGPARGRRAWIPRKPGTSCPRCSCCSWRTAAAGRRRRTCCRWPPIGWTNGYEDFPGVQGARL